MDWLRDLMRGRNGTDQLIIALIVAYWPLTLLGRWTGFAFMETVALALLIVAVFRFFSKDLTRRQFENQKFLSLWYPVKYWFYKTYRDARGMGVENAFVYFRCPNCSQNLRLPAGKGKITIRCPKCSTYFDEKT